VWDTTARQLAIGEWKFRVASKIHFILAGLASNSCKVMAGWPISFFPNTKPGVKRKQKNVTTKADKRKYEDKRDRCFQEHWLEKIYRTI
jgi:hypothetical protein